MVTEDSTSTLKLIFQAQLQTNRLLERIAGAMERQGPATTDQGDPDIMEALMLVVARPNNILHGGKISISKIAKRIGCDRRKLSKNKIFQRALINDEGTVREARQGHYSASDGGLTADGVSVEDWEGIDTHLDE